MTKVLHVRDIMSPNFISVKPETDLVEALQTILSKNTPSVCVVNGEGKLVGMLSENDCLKTVVQSAYHNNAVMVGKVSELMSTDIKTVNPDMDMYSLASLFVTYSFRRYPVIEEGILLGTISRRDVLRAVKGMIINEKGSNSSAIMENPKDTRLTQAV